MTKAQILIVEDDNIVVLELRDRLQKLGYAVCGVAYYGEEAVEKAAERQPDLVLMDIRLRGDVDGIEAADEIRARFPIPVVYLTAYADEDTLQRAKVTEPYGYILKPFQERELHIAIEMALYKHTMERKLRDSEEALKEYSERLEEMVEERTAELRKAQEQLIRREKLAILGQMAGGVAHELRNPLATISNAAYLLTMIRPDADETTKEYLGMIIEEVHRASGIISDLLGFSRTRTPDRRMVAVSELVAKVLEKRPPPERVEVTIEIPPDLPRVGVDRDQMEQVLGNLVTNAYQSMEGGGNLTISAQAEKDEVALSVTDTGCGIAEENMAKVFEPLFTTKTRGIGLGLATSRNLIEANGGSIEVASEMGKGSTFTIILPTGRVA